MDEISRQINELTRKVEQLQQIVERLGYKITNLISDRDREKIAETEPLVSYSQKLQKTYQNNHQNHQYLPSVIEHKDIIDDGDRWEDTQSTYQEYPLSSDIQIRRLTAQLTAAYNRIAALEEQLLARKNSVS